MYLARDVSQLDQVERLVDLGEPTLPEHLQDDVPIVQGRVEVELRLAVVVVKLGQAHQRLLLEVQRVQLGLGLGQLDLDRGGANRDELVLLEQRLERV